MEDLIRGKGKKSEEERKRRRKKKRKILENERKGK